MFTDSFILSQGLPGLADPLTIPELEQAHPLWAADLAALGEPRMLAEGAPAGSGIVVAGHCRSTMDVARELVSQGRLAPWGSVLATSQSAGRGQLRRVWHSRPGNLHCTLVCPAVSEHQSDWNNLRPLLLGYLFAEALSGLGEPVEVKWPNDILYGEHKIAGMLVEERAGCILAGIGMNLAWAPGPEELREGHVVDAGKFIPADCMVGPLRLWGALVKRLETGYRTLLEAFSPGEFLTIFRSRLAWMGRRVLVAEGASVRYEAVVRGISGEGGLVLDRAGQEVVLLAGDVTPI